MKLYKVISSNPSIIWVSAKMIQEVLSTDSFNENYLMWKQRCIQNNCFAMKKINDISDEINIGFTSKRDYQSTGIKFLNISNINQFYFKLNNIKYISKEIHKKLKKSQLKSGDVLLTITGTIGDAVVVPDNFGEANISANMVAIRLKKEYNSYYLSAFFNSKYGKLQTKGSSKSNVWANLGVRQVKNIEIPIPSPKIQKYIGDKVRKAEKLREEAERLNYEIDDYFKNHFDELEQHQLNYNKNYKWISSKIVKEKINAELYNSVGLEYEEKISKLDHMYVKNMLMECFIGKSPSKYSHRGIHILKVKNLTNNGIDWSNCEYVDEKYFNKNKKYHLQDGDVFIIPAAHLAKYIGKKVDIYINNDYIKYPKAMASGKIIVIRCNKQIINPLYLCLVMRRNMIYQQIQAQVSGMTASYYPKDVKELCIPIIDKKEQQKLANIYVKVILKKENAKHLINQAKQDVESLIEGTFDESKVN